MNVYELRQQLKELPDDMEIFIDERKTEFTYGLVNSGKVKEINLLDGLYGEVVSKEEVFVLSEE